MATEQDIDKAQRMANKSESAMEDFRELACEYNPEMQPASVEYLLDGKKAIFYFSAPKRQDFRELVRALGSKFRIRVDMHQINEREKAAIVGGIGSCGHEICCKRCGKFASHTSIKMAKAQGLALNPENISGCCGKLLCCLAYEYENYEEFNKRCPKMRGKVQTPDGQAIVCDISMPTETVQLKYGDPEKRVRVPLRSIIKDKRLAQPGQNVRPNKIEKDAWEEALNKTSEDHLDSLYTSQVLADHERESDGKVHMMPRTERKPAQNKNDDLGRKPRRRHTGGKNKRRSNSAPTPSVNQPTARRRRSRTINSSGPRPGQNSSGAKRK